MTTQSNKNLNPNKSSPCKKRNQPKASAKRTSTVSVQISQIGNILPQPKK